MKIKVESIKQKAGDVMNKTKSVVEDVKNNVTQSTSKIAKKVSSNYDDSKEKNNKNNGSKW